MKTKRFAVLCVLFAALLIALYLTVPRNRMAVEPIVITEPEYDYWTKLEKHAPRNSMTEGLAKIIVAESEKKGINPHDMLAIALKESGLWKFIGDGGCSIGLFHINTCAHKAVTKYQALDPVFATQWTADNLVRNGYKEGERMAAIGKHQGGSKVNKTYAYDVADLADKLRK